MFSNLINCLLYLIIANFAFFYTATAQSTVQNTVQNPNQTLTATPHDAAVALDILPFSINSMKTEAIVLTESLIANTPTTQGRTSTIQGRSIFSNSEATATTKLTSTDLLHKVIQPPQREDFELNGAVAIVESSRSPVIQTFGVWETPNFYDIEKLIFDQDGYLIAQRSYYYPEEISEPSVEKETSWLGRLWRPRNNQKKKQEQEETSDPLIQDSDKGQGRKIEGCYALDINFAAEGFDCFDQDTRTLSVTEWDAQGDITKKDNYQLHVDGPWVALHIEKRFVEPSYRIERYYDVSANLTEFKQFDSVEETANLTEHLRFFYNEMGQRVSEAVLNPATGIATSCRFLIYSHFNTLENIRYFSIDPAIDPTTNNQAEATDRQNDSQTEVRSPLTQQSYACEKEIPSILSLEKRTVMSYNWLYDNDLLAGRRKHEISHYDATGELLEHTIFSYSDTAPTTLLAIKKYNTLGNATAAINFDYDKQGRLVQEKRFQFNDGNSGKLLEQNNYIYKARESTLLEQTTEDFEHSRSKLIQSYDESGNITREQRFELFNRLGILSNIFRLKSDVSKSYTSRSFVNELQLEEGKTAKHENYTYVFDYAGSQILNWIQKDEGNVVRKFDNHYSEPHHTIAREICYYPDSLAISPNLVCTSPFER